MGRQSGVMPQGGCDVVPVSQAQHAGGGVAQAGRGLAGVACAELGVILAEDAIARSVRPVLDASVALNPGSQSARSRCAVAGGRDQGVHLHDLLALVGHGAPRMGDLGCSWGSDQIDPGWRVGKLDSAADAHAIACGGGLVGGYLGSGVGRRLGPRRRGFVLDRDKRPLPGSVQACAVSLCVCARPQSLPLCPC